MGMKLMKVFMMHMNMRWCMHIQDHHLDPDDHHHDEMMMKSKSRSKSRIRSKSSSSSKKIIKVVKWEGGMKTYSRRIKVGEVIMESPKHMVCRSDTLYIGQKIPPLPENQVLRPGNTYFLLPSHLFQSVLSFVTVASILSAAAATSRAGAASSISDLNSVISTNNNIDMILKKEKQKQQQKKKSLESCQPFIIQKSASGCSRIRVSDEFLISQIVDDGDEDEDEDEDGQPLDCCNHKRRLCTTPQLQKEYVQLVQSRTQWKPNLPAITESATAASTNFKTARRRPPIPRRKRKNIISSNSSILPHVHKVAHVPVKSSNNTSKGQRKIKLFKSRKSSSSH